MSASPASRSWSQLCYAVLVLIGGSSILQGLLLPSWPSAEALPKTRIEAGLASAGFRLQPLPSQPAHRAHDLSTSAVIGWRLNSGDELRMMSGSVRRFTDLQAAFLARNQSNLTLQRRRLDDPQPGTARGRIAGEIAFQTCLVPGLQGPAAYGVSNLQLNSARKLRPRSRADVANNLLGLPPSREISCVLITLRGSGGVAPPASSWEKLLATLKPEFQNPPDSP